MKNKGTKKKLIQQLLGYNFPAGMAADHMTVWIQPATHKMVTINPVSINLKNEWQSAVSKSISPILD